MASLPRMSIRDKPDGPLSSNADFTLYLNTYSLRPPTFFNLNIRLKFAFDMGFRAVMGVFASHRYVPRATPCKSFPFFPLKTLKVMTQVVLSVI